MPKATFHQRKWATDVTLNLVSSNCIFFVDLKLHTWSTNQVSVVLKLLTESLLWLIYVTTRATHLNFFHLFRVVIPEMDIFSSPPNHTLTVGADINLTCIAWPRYDHRLYPRRWTKYIQWYDPQGRPVGAKCLQGTSKVKKLRCVLMLKRLTMEQFGNYTCEVRMIMRDTAGKKLSKLSCKVGKTYKLISSSSNEASAGIC